MNEPKNPWKTPRRWIIVGLALVAMAALLYAVYRPRAITVEVAQVATGRFEQVIEEDGQLRLKKPLRHHRTHPGPAAAAHAQGGRCGAGG